MKKFVVTTYATAEWQCIVEVDDDASMEEVEEKVWAGDYEELNNGNPTKIEDEQIECIVEQPDDIIDKIKEEDKSTFMTSRMLKEGM
tara:strand:- start:32 stop:292 length:261 start_codon:yes stop_codon:yes gene_type:complete